MKSWLPRALPFLGFTLGLSAILGGCNTRPRDEYVEVAPNETAFLIALEGDTLKNQQKLNSVDFLEQNRVSTKRVLIPHKVVDRCHSCILGDWVDMPTAKLIKIDRSPVTREWTSTHETGTSASNQAFAVETNESIDFKIGATLTARVAEGDAARFLYFYAGKQLPEIADSNIRSFVGASLARQFGANSLDWGRRNKIVIFAQALKEAQEFFGPKGITIDTLGFTEGMTYTDNAIQRAINEKFEADMAVETAKQRVQAAEQIAKATQAVQVQQDLQLKARALDLQEKAIAKWDGRLPQVVGSEGKLLFGIPAGQGK